MHPRHPLVDRSPLLLLEGYRFAERRRRRDDEDLTPTRVSGSRAVLVRGAAAAQWFYTDPVLRRADALPGLVTQPLFGPGAVHALDAAAHGARKAWFVDVVDAAMVRERAEDLAVQWAQEVGGWSGHVDVFRRASTVLTRVALDGAGLPVGPTGLDARRRDLLAMVDGFGSVGPRHLRARTARARSQAWVVGLLRQVRRGEADSALLSAALDLRDEHGGPVDETTAATEVLNVVRPQVAVSWLVAGGAVALARHPDVRRGVARGDVDPFALAQEVRRTVPFVPMLAARAGRDTTWQGTRVREGTLVVLDVWGTDHDPRAWDRPRTFDPGRFAHRHPTPFDLVPQGGGSRETGHRCPGEDLTLAYLAVMLPELARSSADVVEPPSDLRRMPPRPRCRAVLP